MTLYPPSLFLLSQITRTGPGLLSVPSDLTGFQVLVVFDQIGYSKMKEFTLILSGFSS